MSELKQFRQALKGKDFLILDTETTGLHDGEIVQIAIIDSDGKTRFNAHVKPILPIPPESTRIHGITDETVKDAKKWKDLVPTIKGILKDQLLVVYNAVYDRRMMHLSAERNGIEKIEWKEIAQWHCAMEAFAEFYGDWNNYHGSYRWQRLTTAARYCRVPVADAHDAHGDCLMTLGVVRYMLNGGE